MTESLNERIDSRDRDDSGSYWLIALVSAAALMAVIDGTIVTASLETIAAATAGPARMGRVMGAVSGVINVAPVVGPLAGGLLAGGGHWQWIFLINVPLGAVVLIGVSILMRREDSGRGAVEMPDPVGMLLLPAGFVVLLLGIEQLGRSPLAVPGIIAGGALLAGYAVRSIRSTRPAVLDLRLLDNPGFRAGLAVMAAVGFTMYFQLVALALLAQRHLDLHGAASGSLVAVLGVGLLISMTVSGRRSDDLGPRRIVRVAALATSVVAVLIALLHDAVPVIALAGIVLLMGIGFGAVAAPSFTSVYRSVPEEKVQYATPSLFVTVQLCAAVGASVAALLMARMTATDAITVGYLVIGALLALAAVASRRLPGPV